LMSKEIEGKVDEEKRRSWLLNMRRKSQYGYMKN